MTLFALLTGFALAAFAPAPVVLAGPQAQSEPSPSLRLVQSAPAQPTGSFGQNTNTPSGSPTFSAPPGINTMQPGGVITPSGPAVAPMVEQMNPQPGPTTRGVPGGVLQPNAFPPSNLPAAEQNPNTLGRTILPMGEQQIAPPATRLQRSLPTTVIVLNGPFVLPMAEQALPNLFADGRINGTNETINAGILGEGAGMPNSAAPLQAPRFQAEAPIRTFFADNANPLGQQSESRNTERLGGVISDSGPSVHAQVESQLPQQELSGLMIRQQPGGVIASNGNGVEPPVESIVPRSRLNGSVNRLQAGGTITPNLQAVQDTVEGANPPLFTNEDLSALQPRGFEEGVEQETRIPNVRNAPQNEQVMPPSRRTPPQVEPPVESVLPGNENQAPQVVPPVKGTENQGDTSDRETRIPQKRYEAVPGVEGVKPRPEVQPQVEGVIPGESGEAPAVHPPVESVVPGYRAYPPVTDVTESRPESGNAETQIPQNRPKYKAVPEVESVQPRPEVHPPVEKVTPGTAGEAPAVHPPVESVVPGYRVSPPVTDVTKHSRAQSQLRNEDSTSETFVPQGKPQVEGANPPQKTPPTPKPNQGAQNENPESLIPARDEGNMKSAQSSDGSFSIVSTPQSRESLIPRERGRELGRQSQGQTLNPPSQQAPSQGQEQFSANQRGQVLQPEGMAQVIIINPTPEQQELFSGAAELQSSWEVSSQQTQESVAPVQNDFPPYFSQVFPQDSDTTQGIVLRGGRGGIRGDGFTGPAETVQTRPVDYFEWLSQPWAMPPGARPGVPLEQETAAVYDPDVLDALDYSRTPGSRQ